MGKIKALLYCTKTKPTFYKQFSRYDDEGKMQGVVYHCEKELGGFTLNGTIVAECEIDVEEIYCDSLSNGVGFDFYYYTDTITDVREKSCLDEWQLQSYFGAGIVGEKVGYALHISNLKVFDKPKALSEYHISYYNKELGMMREKHLEKAPQNMCNAFDINDNYILISIQPQWLCKILNGEKDIEIRKQVLNCIKE